MDLDLHTYQDCRPCHAGIYTVLATLFVNLDLPPPVKTAVLVHICQVPDLAQHGHRQLRAQHHIPHLNRNIFSYIKKMLPVLYECRWQFKEGYPFFGIPKKRILKYPVQFSLQKNSNSFIMTALSIIFF
jgi:hypothetical protein